MSFLLFILLILFLMLGLPMLRGWLRLRALRKQVNETFGGRRQQQQQRAQRNDEDDDDEDHKIFDSNDGEYVEFEEIVGTYIQQETSVDDSDTMRQTIVEEQIIDAEFEEIN